MKDWAAIHKQQEREAPRKAIDLITEALGELNWMNDLKGIPYSLAERLRQQAKEIIEIADESDRVRAEYLESVYNQVRAKDRS